MPLRLTDDELTVVYDAARPLAVEMRDPFVRAVARALAGHDVIGVGTVHQVCRELQREFWDAPDFTGHPGGY